MDFLERIRSPDEDWSALARYVKPSDLLALRRIRSDPALQASPHLSALLQTIDGSTNDPALTRLKQLAQPDQHIDQLVMDAAPLPAQDELLLFAAIEDTQSRLERQSPAANPVVGGDLQNTMARLQQRQPPALTIAGLNPRCEPVLPSQNHWLGPPPGHSSTQGLVILLPTRGQAPDVPVEQFLSSLDKSLKAARLFDASQSVLVVLGVNGKDPGQGSDSKTELLKRSKEISNSLRANARGFKHPIQVKQLTFAWATDQPNHQRQIIPFGTIRSHCFNEAINEMRPGSRFISMDGDTTLTGPAIDLIMQLGPSQTTTLAYNLDSQSRKQHPSTSAALELHWKIQADAKLNTDNSHSSLAYPAEPCLAVGSDGLDRLKALHQEGRQIYGPTDCEGRFLMRHLLQAHQRFVPVDPNVLVDFHNFERFAVKDHPVHDREGLIRQLSAYAGQTQNMANLDFFTRQLAFGLAIHDASVRPITRHFYVPGFMRQGFGLSGIKKLLQLDLRSHDQIEDPLLSTKLQEMRAGYLQTQALCGTEVADSVLDNAKRWANAVADHALAAVSKHPKLMRDVLSHHPTLQEGVAQATHTAPRQHPALVEPHAAAVRNNKDPRGVYPQIPKPLETTALSSLKRPLSLDAAIPRKRRAIELLSAQAPMSPAAASRPNHTGPNNTAQLDFHTRYQMAFKDAGGLFRDMFSLLGPEHFGLDHMMSDSEISQAFYQRVLDHDRAPLPTKPPLTDLIKQTLRDLLA